MRPWTCLFLIPFALPGAEPRPHPRPLPGAYRQAPTDAPMVVEAKAFLEKELPCLHLGPVQEASIQRVAGVNVRLVCTAALEEDRSTWELLAYRDLKGRWKWISARRRS